jgi:hypothetical protein
MLSLRPSAAKPSAYGYILLFAYISLLVAFVFLANGGWRSYQQNIEATKWPAVDAQVTNCSVDFTYGYGGKAYGRKFRAQCVLHYEANGVPFDTKKVAGSIVFVSDKQLQLTKPRVTVAMLRDWVRLHPRGSSLTIHYDPSDPHHISLAGADAVLQKNTPQEQLSIGQGLFFFGMALLLVGMLLRRRVETSQVEGNALPGGAPLQ